MILVTTDVIDGKRLEPLGIVEGSCIQTVHVGKDIMASLTTLVGGELTSYQEMVESSRRTAISRMISNANQYNADAIVGVRFSTSSVMQSAAEIMVYGTAVKFL